MGRMFENRNEKIFIQKCEEEVEEIGEAVRIFVNLKGASLKLRDHRSNVTDATLYLDNNESKYIYMSDCNLVVRVGFTSSLPPKIV